MNRMGAVSLQRGEAECGSDFENKVGAAEAAKANKLAVYDGGFRSGTGATVRYARKLGRELIVIDPVTLTVTHEKAVQ